MLLSFDLVSRETLPCHPFVMRSSACKRLHSTPQFTVQNTLLERRPFLTPRNRLTVQFTFTLNSLHISAVTSSSHPQNISIPSTFTCVFSIHPSATYSCVFSSRNFHHRFTSQSHFCFHSSCFLFFHCPCLPVPFSHHAYQ